MRIACCQVVFYILDFCAAFGGLFSQEDGASAQCLSCSGARFPAVSPGSL